MAHKFRPEFVLKQENSCMPNSLNQYFNKKLFTCFAQFLKKMQPNLKAMKVNPHSTHDFNLLAFATCNYKRHYRDFLYRSHSKSILRFITALRSLERSRKYIVHYRFKVSNALPKDRYKSHCVCIYIDRCGKVFIMEKCLEEDNGTLPLINLDMNRTDIKKTEKFESDCWYICIFDYKEIKKNKDANIQN